MLSPKVKSLLDKAPPEQRIFISYRRQDGEAERCIAPLSRKLREVYDENAVFWDQADMALGDFRVQLTEALGEADAVIVMISDPEK